MNTTRATYTRTPDHQAAFDKASAARLAALAAQGTDLFDAAMDAYRAAGAELGPFIDAEHEANLAMATIANLR